METVNINVGGTLFTTLEDTLKSIPESRLANICKESPEYNNEKEWYFFDRNPEVFNSVLDLYRTGDLHVPSHVCGTAVVRELQFWRVPCDKISSCCFATICKHEEGQEVARTLKDAFENKDLEYSLEELENSVWKRRMNDIWKFMEQPLSSFGAKIFTMVYFTFVLLTTTTFILGSHPIFRTDKSFITELRQHNIQGKYNVTIDLVEYLKSTMRNQKYALYFTTDNNYGFFVIERMAAMFFAVDLVLRFVVCPKKTEFAKSFLNILDCILVIASMTSFGLEFHESLIERSEGALWVYIVCKGFVILRLCRILRLVRYIEGLKVLEMALRKSIKELCLLILVFIIACSLFSGIMYYAEFHFDNDFTDIPITMWWAVVTMTTVGYGDMTPSSVGGYIVATFCAIAGLLLMAMPIAIVANSFSEYYSQNNTRSVLLNFRKKSVHRRWSWTIKELKNVKKNQKVHPTKTEEIDTLNLMEKLKCDKAYTNTAPKE